MRAAGKVTAGALALAAGLIRPGVTTGVLDTAIEEFIRSRGGIPTFKGYRQFPASACISVNEEVVHGIPGPRTLQEGDIVTVDVGVTLDGYIGDSAWTWGVGRISTKAQRLLKATRESLFLAIEQMRPGSRLSQVSRAVQNYAEASGFGVVRKFAGHGLGKDLHEEPQVPNYVDRLTPGNDIELKAGMVLAIEPMLTEGDYDVRTLEDNWTVVTKDRKLSAHFEHTVAITSGGHEILTTDQERT
ncbi:MAG: type I methionyl aminopeptidase [Candidatus Brocadiae bacterium]|nr:type I methionyl aminopeptidase [Candidatus Brocadiia bacterium]